jgi:polyisoprenoid-binding protein YceI
VIRRVVLGLALLTLTAAGEQSSGWRVDHDASRIEMTVRALGGSHVGSFEEWSGDLAFNPDQVALTRARVTVQTRSLRMQPAAATGRALGPGFLDAARHPTIAFSLRSLEPLGQDRYTARADVTLKGVTRPLTFPVDLRLTGGRAHLTGAFVVDRTDFGIGTTGPWNRLVDRRVTVRVQLQARRS